MKSNWNYPTTVWVGKDRVKDLGEACHNLKIKNPLFVTDKDLVNLTFIKEVIIEIKKKFKKLILFSNFTGNPFGCLLYTSPSPRDMTGSRMPSSA